MAIKQRQVWVVYWERGQPRLGQTTETETPGGCTVSHLRPAPVRLIIGPDARRSELMRLLEAVKKMDLSGLVGPERNGYQP